MAVYQKGAHSKSFAEVTLDTALSSAVTKGVAVVGKNANGDEIAGSVYADAAAGDSVLKVQYDTSSVQATYVGCQVGGSPTPVTDGCKPVKAMYATLFNTTTV